MRSSLMLASAVAAAALLASCGNYKEPTFGEPGSIVDKKLPGDSSSSGGSTPGGSADEDPFVGKTASALGAVAADSHAAKAGPTEELAVDCMSAPACHAGGGTPPKFIAAGKRAIGADVMIVRADGTTLGPVTADKNGYFWFIVDGAVTDVGDNAQAFSKKDGQVNAMQASLVGPQAGSCERSGCHGTNQQVAP